MLWDHIKRDMTVNLDKNTFTGWRKELISKLKEWDKYYMKHQKTTNPELALIHSSALQPLVNLMDSSFNYYNFKLLVE